MTVQRYDIHRLDYDEYVIEPIADGDYVSLASCRKLSAALADMIDMYENKKRDSLRLGNARAVLTNHGEWPELSSTVRPQHE